MYCISYNLYKYIQRLSLRVFGRKMEEENRVVVVVGWGRFLLHRCMVKRWTFREKVCVCFFFFMSVFHERVGRRWGKWLFVHKWSSLLCGSAEEDILDVAASAWGGGGENVLPLPARRTRQIFLPSLPPTVEVSAPQSSQVCKAFMSQRYSLIFIEK